MDFMTNIYIYSPSSKVTNGDTNIIFPISLTEIIKSTFFNFLIFPLFLIVYRYVVLGEEGT